MSKFASARFTTATSSKYANIISMLEIPFLENANMLMFFNVATYAKWLRLIYCVFGASLLTLLSIYFA